MRHYTSTEIISDSSILEDYPSSGPCVPLVCDTCGVRFMRARRDIVRSLQLMSHPRFRCSKTCMILGQTTSVTKSCASCQKPVTKVLNQFKRSKTGNIFCSISCGTKFNNLNKSHGTTRSKLEIFIEQKIRSDFPNLECLFNSKKTIGSELDFYFPSLKLAIELNGIFHYEPIHGPEKLERIQQNDQNKYAACRSAGIEIIVVPSVRSYYKPKDKELVWDGIKKIIDSKTGS